MLAFFPRQRSRKSYASLILLTSCILIPVIISGCGASPATRQHATAHSNIHPVTLDSVHMFDARQGWALSMDDQATISGIVRTTDGGRTWSKHGGFKGLQSVSFASIRSGVAQDSNSCSLQLSTQDGGQSWSSYHYSITA